LKSIFLEKSVKISYYETMKTNYSHEEEFNEYIVQLSKTRNMLHTIKEQEKRLSFHKELYQKYEQEQMMGFRNWLGCCMPPSIDPANIGGGFSRDGQSRIDMQAQSQKTSTTPNLAYLIPIFISVGIALLVLAFVIT